MGKHKKPRVKRKVSKEEFERRYKIWTLVVSIILAVIPAAATIALELIKRSPPPPKDVRYSKMLESGPLEKAETERTRIMVSIPKEQLIQTNQKNAYMRRLIYRPVIIVILIFPCVFFTAKFIGRTFVRSRYELVEIDEGKKIDGG